MVPVLIMNSAKPPINKAHIRERWRYEWEQLWSNDKFNPKWGNRGVSIEIVQAVKSGWLPSGGRVLDVGCGVGEVAAWFAQRGYETLGVDIAHAAINKARTRYMNTGIPLEFSVLDVSDTPPPDRQYNIIIDRGCLHQIAPALLENYITNLTQVCAPNAKMLLFIKAFREGQTIGDTAELNKKLKWVSQLFANQFHIESYAVTHLGKKMDEQLSTPLLPGIFIKLVR